MYVNYELTLLYLLGSLCACSSTASVNIGIPFGTVTIAETPYIGSSLHNYSDKDILHDHFLTAVARYNSLEDTIESIHSNLQMPLLILQYNLVLDPVGCYN